MRGQRIELGQLQVDFLPPVNRGPISATFAAISDHLYSHFFGPQLSLTLALSMVAAERNGNTCSAMYRDYGRFLAARDTRQSSFISHSPSSLRWELIWSRPEYQDFEPRGIFTPRLADSERIVFFARPMRWPSNRRFYPVARRATRMIIRPLTKMESRLIVQTVCVSLARG